MVAKTKECQNVHAVLLRKASRDLNAIESEIQGKILAAAKNLLDGGYVNPLDFAGSFRVYEMIIERFDNTRDGYMAHQERCLCDIPDDLDELF